MDGVDSMDGKTSDIMDFEDIRSGMHKTMKQTIRSGFNHNPFYEEPIDEAHSNLFVGKSEEIQKILTGVQRVAYGRHVANYILIGEMGAGKTSLINILDTLIREQGFVVIRVDDLPAKNTLAHIQEIMDALIPELGKRLRHINLGETYRNQLDIDLKRYAELQKEWFIYENACIKFKSVPEAKKAFLKCIEYLPNKSGITILTDEAHNLPKLAVHSPKYINELLHTKKVMQLFALYPHEVEQMNSNYQSAATLQRFTRVRLEAFSVPATEKLISKRLSKARTVNHGDGSIAPFTHDAVVEVQRISEGHPRKIIELCEAAFNKILMGEAIIVNDSLIKEVSREIYHNELKSITTSLSEEQLRIIKLLIAGPCGPTELTRRYEETYHNQLPKSTAGKMLRVLAETTPMVIRDRDGVYFVPSDRGEVLVFKELGLA